MRENENYDFICSTIDSILVARQWETLIVSLFVDTFSRLMVVGLRENENDAFVSSPTNIILVARHKHICKISKCFVVLES